MVKRSVKVLVRYIVIKLIGAHGDRDRYATWHSKWIAVSWSLDRFDSIHGSHHNSELNIAVCHTNEKRALTVEATVTLHRAINAPGTAFG